MPIRRLYELYAIGGLEEVTKGIKGFFRRRLPFLRNPYFMGRHDNEDRWEFIRPYLSDTSSLVDIGCAEGFFTKKAAKEGIFSIGIDNDDERLQHARSLTNFIDGCGYIKLNISPKNIHKLPEVDTILLLTVHHHWEGAFGQYSAEKMFQVVMDKCDTMIYEPPGDRPLIKEQRGELNPEDSLDFYQSRLSANYGDSIKILDAQMFDYGELRNKERERADPVFVLDTSEYQFQE